MRVLYNSILLSKFANSNIYRTMKMAKLKIWMVALTLIMGVSLTSCINGDDNTIQPVYGPILLKRQWILHYCARNGPIC